MTLKRSQTSQTTSKSSQASKTFFQLLQIKRLQLKLTNTLQNSYPIQSQHQVPRTWVQQYPKTPKTTKNKRKSLSKLFHTQTGSIWFQIGSYLVPIQSRSLSGRHVSTGFLDPALGAMMKQVCWHLRRSKAYRGLPEARMAGATVEETAFEDVNMWQALPFMTLYGNLECGRDKSGRRDLMGSQRVARQGPEKQPF